MKVRIFSPFIALKHLFEKPITIRVPKIMRAPAKNYRGFHTLNIDKCISCGSCMRSCPASAIRLVPIENKEGGVPEIDYGRCTYCQLCVDACPTEALGYSNRYIFTTEIETRFAIIPPPKEILDEYPLPKLAIKEITRTDDYQKIVFMDGKIFEIKYKK